MNLIKYKILLNKESNLINFDNEYTLYEQLKDNKLT